MKYVDSITIEKIRKVLIPRFISPAAEDIDFHLNHFNASDTVTVKQASQSRNAVINYWHRMFGTTLSSSLSGTSNELETRAEQPAPMRHFVDTNGVIYYVTEDGSSNFNGLFQIVGNTIQILGEKDSTDPDPNHAGRIIEDEYQLWPSLTALATQIDNN